MTSQLGAQLLLHLLEPAYPALHKGAYTGCSGLLSPNPGITLEAGAVGRGRGGRHNGRESKGREEGTGGVLLGREPTVGSEAPLLAPGVCEHMHVHDGVCVHGEGREEG